MKPIYGTCYGIVVPENRGHPIKVFALKGSQLKM